MIVRAAPGEANVMRVEARPRGVLVSDPGTELTAACRPATTTAGRFCRGVFADGELFLGDGNDSVEVDAPWLAGGRGAGRGLGARTRYDDARRRRHPDAVEGSGLPAAAQTAF